MVEHVPDKNGVEGSIPSTPTRIQLKDFLPAKQWASAMEAYQKSWRKVKMVRKLALFFLFLGSIIVLLFFVYKEHIAERGKLSLPESLTKEIVFINENNEENDPFYLKMIPDVRDDYILEGKSFIEVNLGLMQLRVYKDGDLIKQVPILARGDPQGWGGSALGVYNVLSGYRSSYSGIAEVYIPFALHYYGKYWLHGEPYYPNGQKMISAVSGGCIRMHDNDAKDIYDLAEINMPVIVLDNERIDHNFVAKDQFDFPKVSAKSYIVADLNSGFVFANKNHNEKLPLASLTKLMTAIVVAENIDLRRIIQVEPEMLKAYGDTDNIEVGKRFGVVELFYPLLIESSNDAAEVLSGFLGREKTIELMNKKAQNILMSDTRFIDPHGYEAGNISTAQDLFQLAKYITEARILLWNITKGEKETTFKQIEFDIEEFWNKNIFTEDENLIGGKTGFIEQSKNNAIFVFKFLAGEQVKNVAIILMGSDDDKRDTQIIYKWLKDNYSLLSVVPLDDNNYIE